MARYSPYVLHVRHSDDSFTVNLNLEIKAYYIDILTLKLPQIQSQSIYFSNFPGGACPQTP